MPSRFVKKTLVRVLSAALAASVILPAPFEAPRAGETRIVLAPDGRPMFELKFFDEGEDYNDWKEIDEEYAQAALSTRTLNEAERGAVLEAARRWAEILGPGSLQKAPLRIHIGTIDIENAYAESLPYGFDGLLALQAESVVQKGATQAYSDRIVIGNLNAAEPERPAHIPTLPDVYDLTASLFHEMGHSLGICSLASSFNDEETGVAAWSVFDSHLVDRHGNSIGAGTVFVHENLDPGAGVEGVFVVGDATRSGVVFRGRNVDEVLGSDKGITVEGFEGDALDLSHLELPHVLMSHQYWRNYTTFTEAELAVMQDIGYTIDRRSFYGRSIYADGQAIENTDGFFARNPEGTAYVEGKPNTTTLGVGLHVFGRSNTVRQLADLLACGDGATGIRIDGASNTIEVESGVRVAANGYAGTGILTAYGKNHALSVNGTVEALGEGGIALRFDFGRNVINDENEYRGSWQWGDSSGFNEIYGTDEQLDWDGFLLDLNGPLVKRVDISGRISGSEAAVFIADNAFVEEINVLPGAAITGDIVSEWDPENERVQRPDLVTTLRFGASEGSGEDFDLTLEGGIYAQERGMDLVLENGTLTVRDGIVARSVANHGRLILASADDDRLSAIVSSFTQGKGALLETGFYADGGVARIEAGEARLGGTWRLRPMADFYPSDAEIVIQADSPFDVGRTSGQFESVDVAEGISPVLGFSMTDTSGGRVVSVTRAADAYAAWALASGEASVGRALANGAATIAAEDEHADARSLFAALDWSASGAAVLAGLKELSPEAYDAAARAVLDAQSAAASRTFARLADAGLRSASMPVGETSYWGEAFSTNARQGAYGASKVFSGYKSTDSGASAGIEKRLDADTIAGLEITASAGKVTMKDGISATARSRTGMIGVYGRTTLEEVPGLWLGGSARIGFAAGEMERTVALSGGNGYLRSSSADWTGAAGGLMIAGGLSADMSAWRGTFSFGPVARVELNLLHRPGIDEEQGGASRLALESETYRSLPFVVGARAAWTGELSTGGSLAASLTAAWKHELLDGTLETEGRFLEMADGRFTSSTEISGRDVMQLEGRMHFVLSDAVSAGITLGGELFGTDASSFSAAANLRLNF